MHKLKIRTLDRDYCDRDVLFLHACFQVLSDFVEKELEPYEEKFGTEHEERWGKAFSEMRELLKWWKDWNAPGRRFKTTQELTDWYKNGELREKEMLHRLVAVRGYMWT